MEGVVLNWKANEPSPREGKLIMDVYLYEAGLVTTYQTLAFSHVVVEKLKCRVCIYWD